jgi:radical SAM protein with 4Fe4S-binding SPASM domain
LLRKENFGWLCFDRKECRTGYAGDIPLKKINGNILDQSDIVNLPKDNYSTLSAPTRVFFVLSKKCNLNCVYCSNNSSIINTEEFSLGKAKEILRELKKLGVFEISFNGGEAVLYPHFEEITNEAKKLGFVSFINTNGVYPDEYRKKLLNSGIEKIKVSLDGPEKINDSLRGKGSFNEAMKTIRYLHSNGANVKIVCTLLKDNLPYMLELVKIAESIPCEIKFAPMHKVGRAKKIKVSPIKIKDLIKKKKEIMDYCEKKGIKHLVNINTTLFSDVSKEKQLLTSKHIKCCVDRSHASIDANGAVYLSGCQTSFETSKSMGNVYDSSFLNIWGNAKKINEKEKMSSPECKRCVLSKRMLKFLDVTGDYKGEVWENEKTKSIFKD